MRKAGATIVLLKHMKKWSIVENLQVVLVKKNNGIIGLLYAYLQLNIFSEILD
jgi:hypothetical protein